jgi:cold shock CspA family protein
MAMRGTIARMGARGFGFIEPADEGARLFFHVSDCHLRGTYLNVGDRVEYEINQLLGRDSKGRQRACAVRPVVK